MPELTKLTVNLVPEAYAAVEAGATLTGYTFTDFINRALQMYQAIEKAAADGASSGMDIEINAADAPYTLIVRSAR